MRAVLCALLRARPAMRPVFRDMLETRRQAKAAGMWDRPLFLTLGDRRTFGARWRMVCRAALLQAAVERGGFKLRPRVVKRPW